MLKQDLQLEALISSGVENISTPADKAQIYRQLLSLKRGAGGADNSNPSSVGPGETAILKLCTIH